MVIKPVVFIACSGAHDFVDALGLKGQLHSSPLSESCPPTRSSASSLRRCCSRWRMKREARSLKLLVQQRSSGNIIVQSLRTAGGTHLNSSFMT